MASKKAIILWVLAGLAVIAGILAGIGALGLKKLMKQMEKAQVWVEDIATGESGPITHDGMNTHPVFSSDGSRVVYLSRKDVKSEQGSSIQVYSFAGGTVETVLESKDLMLSPQWTAGDQGILYSKSDGEDRDLVVFDLKTRETKPVTNDPIAEEDPKISPDGKWIAFFQDEEDGKGLYVMSSAGGEKELAVQKVNFLSEPKGLAWSGDSAKIAFVSFLELVVQDVASGEQTRTLLQGLNNMGGLFFDPKDPDWIYLRARAVDGPAFEFNLYRIHWKTGERETVREKRKLTELQYGISPDGSRLVYARA